MMRIVVQRVSQAAVEVHGKTVGAIDAGLLVYVSVTHEDTDDDAAFVANKLVGLRVFGDDHGKMNRAIDEIGGAMLIVSQFTLHGDIRKGRRPSFTGAAEPYKAQQLYEQVIERVRAAGIAVETGVFAAHMHVTSCNDGPVTFLLDTRPV